jgi:hypothetical protein
MRRRRLAVTFTALLGIALFIGTDARAGDVPTERMDAHMETTVHAPLAAGDRARADAIVSAARKVMAQYPTVAAAEQAGFTKFLPKVPLPIEHYTNNAYAMEAYFGTFDPMHPTSLIFKREGQALKLVGVMYTAARDADASDLNARVPLSIAKWHRHVAFCAGPAGTPPTEYFGADAKFGLLGSIATKDACDAAGGTFKPIVFGWMVHVWPTESDPSKVWADDPDGSMSNGSAMTEPMR